MTNGRFFETPKYEYRRWPFAIIQGPLDEIEKVQQGTLKLDGLGIPGKLLSNQKYGTLSIRRRKPGREIQMGNATLGSAKYILVPLQELEGWEDGSLETALRTYAPHAFQ
jgi:hypothetical protein